MIKTHDERRLSVRNQRLAIIVALGVIASLILVVPQIIFALPSTIQSNIPSELPATVLSGQITYLPSLGRGVTPKIIVTGETGEAVSAICGLRPQFVGDRVIPCNDAKAMKLLFDGNKGHVWYFDVSALEKRVVQISVDNGPQFYFADQIPAIRANAELSQKSLLITLILEVIGVWALTALSVYLFIRHGREQ